MNTQSSISHHAVLSWSEFHTIYQLKMRDQYSIYSCHSKQQSHDDNIESSIILHKNQTLVGLIVLLHSIPWDPILNIRSDISQQLTYLFTVIFLLLPKNKNHSYGVEQGCKPTTRNIMNDARNHLYH